MNVTESPTDVRGLRMRLLRLPTLTGSGLALLFWWYSLTPTLIPRSVVFQVAVSGVCAAIGYGLGTLVERAVARFAPTGRRALRHTKLAWIVVGSAWLMASLFGGRLWLQWQNGQHRLMGSPTVAWPDAVVVVTLSIVMVALLVILARAVGVATAALRTQFDRRVPSAWATGPVFVVALGLALALTGVIAFRGLTAMANSIYREENDDTSPGLVVPTSSTVSGSAGSLVSWDTLGRNGRDFVAGVTTSEEIRAFHGAGASVVEPVRVYVGVQSADSFEARTGLAVRELERAGGFERKVLVVWVPTGAGWVIAEAATALEQMHRGDTAIVAVQYSVLPSLLGVFMDPGLAVESGAALINAVTARWSQLPSDRRPKLLLFAKSLGTSGLEAPFAAVDAASSIANMASRVDGALIVGAKYTNPIHRQVTGARDSGSPVWQPVFDRGRTVRFVTRDPNQPDLDTSRTGPRIVYLQHPSDPVTFWGVDALWSPPEWMDTPRGYDVPEAARWFPIVSAVQSVADLIDQLSPPPGFGHVFSTDYVNGWAEVLPPDGWTEADTEQLDRFLDTEHADDSEP